MTKWPLVQPDLFEERRKSLPAPQRVKAVELLQGLLAEAMAPPTVIGQPAKQSGASDDQDHT